MEEIEKYDVIVVGAGNGGLAAAAYASKNGLKTLLFEKHNIPGGAVTSFRRGRFEFEPSLHEMCEVGSEEKPGNTRKMFDEIGSDAKFVYENSLYRVISTDPKDPFDVSFPADFEEFYKTIEKECPGDGEKVRRFIELEKEAIETSEKLTVKKISLKDIPSIFNTFRMVAHSSDRVMDLLGISKKAQHMITPYWSYVGEPTSTVNAFMMGMMDYCYLLDGAGLPSSFSHEFSLSFDKIIRNNGGKIFYNSPVTKVIIKRKNGHRTACGVIANGKKYFANYIVCNCFPEDVFGRMVEKRKVPLFELQKSSARKPAYSFVNVHMGLNKTIEQLGINDYSTFILEHADSTEQWKSCYGLGGKGWIIANALNKVIPECSPEGTTHMSITCAVVGEEWANIKPEEYKKKKLEIAEHMIDMYEKSTGITIKPYIEEIEVATPVTYSRYLGTPNGTPYGYQRSNWDGIFLRTMNAIKEETVNHLLFVGAHTEEAVGYNQTYKSGRRVALRIAKEISKEKKNR